MTDPVSDETRPAATDASGSAGGAAAAPDETGERRRYRGWYWLGILIQVFVWTLIWLGIAIAVGVGGELTEFRYVGF